MTKKKVFCSGALIVEDSRFLFGKRIDGELNYAGMWDVIGGHNENDENPEQTLNRELMEELGIEAINPELFYQVTVDDDPSEDPYQFYIFLVRQWTGEISNCSNEHSELRWFTENELRDVTLSSTNYWLLIDKWKNGGSR